MIANWKLVKEYQQYLCLLTIQQALNFCSIYPKKKKKGHKKKQPTNQKEPFSQKKKALLKAQLPCIDIWIYSKLMWSIQRGFFNWPWSAWFPTNSAKLYMWWETPTEFSNRNTTTWSNIHKKPTQHWRTGDPLVITLMYGIPAYLSKGTQNQTNFGKTPPKLS